MPPPQFPPLGFDNRACSGDCLPILVGRRVGLCFGIVFADIGVLG